MNWIFALVIAMVSTESVCAADDLIAAAQKTGQCKVFLKTIQVAGLTQTIKGYGSLTIFAPTDEGFARMPKDIFDALMKPENKTRLAGILLAHIVKGKIMAADIRTATVTTLGNAKIHSINDGSSLSYGDATVVKPDLIASNGVIHLIDKVVLPEQQELSVDTRERKTSGSSSRKN